MKWNRGLLAGTLGVAAAVLLGGLWLEQVVSAQLETGLEEELTTLRDTNLLALREWMKAQEKATSFAVNEERIRDAALQVISSESHQLHLSQAEAAHTLQERLSTTLKHWEFQCFLLLSGRRIVASDDQRYLGQEIDDTEYLRLLVELEEGRSLLTRPRKLAWGKEHEYVMWAASAIRDARGVQGALAFRIDPTKSFARILRTAQFGRSGETLAFDAQGVLLSSSRFDAQLQKIGLLEAETGSVLQLTLRDPGVDLTSGLAVPKTLSAHDLTKAARSAIDGRTGADVEGYADYRGVPVAAAWTWLPEYEFGLVTKVDWEEAFASAKVIRNVTRVLVGMLLFLALVLVFVGQFVAQLRHEAKRLGQYTLQKKIGEGGMGTVYRAQHAFLKRPTAIKMIKVHDIDDKTRARFEREVQATARLTNPNTIAIYDYGHSDEGVFYYAMEYLTGLTLYELVRSHGTVDQARLVHILKQVLSSLSEAHEAGLVHRDIKPTNIMLSYRGGVPDMVKVLDFGLVKDISKNSLDVDLTATNALTGTPHYMSPESITDASEVDQRSDLYAVGAVGYFLLTAKELFDGPNSMVILTKHLTEPPPVPSAQGVIIDAGLEALILRCLAKDREQRPATAREVMHELESLSEKLELRVHEQEIMNWWKSRPQLMSTDDSNRISQAPALKIDMNRRREYDC